MKDTVVNKIHRKVSSVLGMDAIPDGEVEDEEFLVPMPVTTDLVPIDNDDLPCLDDEMRRFEHTNRQTEYLIELVIPALENALGDVATLPPAYRARAVEVNAKMLEATTNLIKLRGDLQIKLTELKLKMAGFTRNKRNGNNITGNTFVFNREELIKAYKSNQEDNGAE